MIKTIIYRGVPYWNSFCEVKYFWTVESAQKYCQFIAPKKLGQDRYFFTIVR